MKSNLENITSKLKENNIRLSHQRLKVLAFLDHNRIHPTVDEIYNSLRSEIPTLSKTTVYNTLNALVEAGIVRNIALEDNESRYDIRTDIHGHFKCKACGKIYDFEVDMDLCEVKGLNDFRIDTRDIYFTGTCAECMGKK